MRLVKRISVALTACLVPFLCMAMSQTKESARDWADYVFCGKVVSIATASVIKARGNELMEDEVLMKATLEVLHHHKGPASPDRIVFAYFKTGTGSACPPDVRLEAGHAYLFAAVTNGMKLRAGEFFLLTGDFVDSTNACSAVARRYKVGLADSEALAAFIWSGESRLRKGQVKPPDLVPLLRDSKVIFVDDDGTSVTVRDVAYTMLDEADIVKPPAKGHRCKVICGCKVDGEWARTRIQQLSDDDFEAAIKAIQQPPAGSKKLGKGDER